MRSAGDGSAGGETNRANAAVFLLTASDGLVSTLVAPFLASRGFQVADIGFLVAAYAVASVLSRVPGGRMADGGHLRAWFIVACGLFGFAVLLYPAASGAAAFAAVRFGHGLFSGTATTLNFAAFLGAPGRNRARSTAIYTAAMSAGFTVGNLASGLLADNFGYGVAFTVAALCPAGALLAAPTAEPAQRARGGPAERPAAGALLGSPDSRAILLVAFTIGFIHQTLGTLFPLYGLAIGLSLSVIGAAKATHSFTNTLIRPFGDPLLRWFGPIGLACFGIAGYGLTVASVPLLTAPLALIGAFVLIGAGRACAVVANTLSTAELSDRGVVNRGTASMLLSVGQDAGMLVAPIVAGVTAAQIGIGSTLQILPLAAAGLGLVAVLQARRTRQPASPRTAF